MKKIHLACIICASLGFSLTAQNLKFGKVSKDELQEKTYGKDSTAVAAVLYRSHTTHYIYSQEDGFHVMTDVHERIKIYNKEGFDYATESIRLFRNGGTREKMMKLKANTFNLVDGKVVKTKLKKSDVFSEEVTKNITVEKFTMPNVEEGSIVEYQYSIDSPFASSIDEIPLQYDVPIKKQDVEILIPEYYTFKPIVKGYLLLDPKHTVTTGKIVSTSNSSSSGIRRSTSALASSSFEYEIKKTAYTMDNVPALTEEPYVNNMDNYRSSVNYELQYVKFPGESLKDYTSNWPSVIKSIYASDNFGKQLTYQKYFKEDLNTILANATGNLEKVGGVFFHVQKHMNWNGFYGYFAENGVRKAYKERSGNVADINLMLVSMLKAAGIKANPVLISTRNNGIPLFPTREGFNYVIAMVRMDEGVIFLDATDKYTGPNLLPIRALNWYGRVVSDTGNSETVSVFPAKPSPMIHTMNIDLGADGEITGKYRASHLNYNAYRYRSNAGQIAEEDYLTRLENEKGGLEISNYSVKNKAHIGKPIIESYDFSMDAQADVIGDKIYFNPLFYNTLKENPFKLEERHYPIDFAFPWQERYTMNITIPDGYKVLSKPEPSNLGMGEKMGGFTYKILEDGNKLRVIVDVKVNLPSIPAQYYPQVRELYKKMVEKEAEKIVLVKG